MAIYHCEISSISRAKGHSATAAAAYRAGIRIEDDRLGVIQDYTKRKGVVSFEILAASGSPDWAFDPTRLWNAAEAAETRKNARVAREMEVALPHELTEIQRQLLAREIGQQLVDRYNVAVQIAIHSPDKKSDQRNHHAHILFTSRQIGAHGFTDYAAKIFDDFKRGRKEVRHWREQVATTTNIHLANAGHAARIDHRTLEEQAIDAASRGDLKQARDLDRLPTVKEGHAPARRRHARARNAKIREENVIRQREWDQMEVQAKNEARLMPAYHDRNPGEKKDEDGARTRTVVRSRARRSRKSQSPITHNSVNTDRLRVDEPGRKPVLSMSPSHRVAIVQPRWNAERGRDSLRSTFAGHSSDGGALHFTSSTVLRSRQLTEKPAAQASGAVAESVSNPLQPARVARGSAAPKGAPKIFSSASNTGVGKARLTITGSEYDRRMLQLDQERLDMEADATRHARQRDAEIKALLETLSNMDAIRWKHENRLVIAAQAWLEQHRYDEQRRFNRREKQRKHRDLEWANLKNWEINNPPPWKILPSYKKWLSKYKKLELATAAAHAQYKLAEQAADLPALDELQEKRTAMQRQLERALYNRQAIALLPEEAEHRTQNAALPSAAPTPRPQVGRETPKRAINRWAYLPALRPPGHKN